MQILYTPPATPITKLGNKKLLQDPFQEYLCHHLKSEFLFLRGLKKKSSNTLLFRQETVLWNFIPPQTNSYYLLLPGKNLEFLPQVVCRIYKPLNADHVSFLVRKNNLLAVELDSAIKCWHIHFLMCKHYSPALFEPMLITEMPSHTEPFIC